MTLGSKPVKAKADTLLDIVKSRRSLYALTKTLPTSVTPSRVRHIVEQATLHTPSAFNSQTTRVLVLVGAHHDKLWGDVVPGVLRPQTIATDPDRWARTSDRLSLFAAAAGTVLFFEDDDAARAAADAFPANAHRIGTWAAQSDGMQQYVTWAALELEGLGANLQHYAPDIDEAVAREWGVPASWKGSAQLVFGGVAGEAKEKEFKPLDERVIFFE